MLENVFYTGELMEGVTRRLMGFVLVMYTEGKGRKRNNVFVLYSNITISFFLDNYEKLCTGCKIHLSYTYKFNNTDIPMTN